jgi:hypothetical protein
MEVEFSLIPEDLVALSEYHSSQLPRWKIFLYLGLIILGAGAFILRIRQFVNEAGTTIGLSVAVIAIFGGLIYYLNRHRIAARNIRRQLRQGKNARLLEQRTLKISPEGISYLSAELAAMTMWTAVEKIVVRKDHAFFYVGTATAHILPRRAFANDQEFTDFVETAQRYFEAANKESVPA